MSTQQPIKLSGSTPSLKPDAELLDQTPKKVSMHLDLDRMMDCIHCGLCLPTCPTYAETGLEAESPRGRIYLMRSLAEGRTSITASFVEHMDSCLGCRACETACPSGVQYGHLIEGTRAHLFEHYERQVDQRLKNRLVEFSFPYPNRMELALAPVRVLRRSGIIPLLRKLGVMKLLGNLGDMEALLPPLPPMQKRLKFPVRWKARGPRQASVGMITGCVMQVMQSHVNEATARVLCKSGCDVAAPKTQNCCGALHAHIGDMEKAKELARCNIAAFEDWEKEHGALDAIVINAAGCGAVLKEYPGWFKDDDEWETRSKNFSEKVQDVSEFLDQDAFKARLQDSLRGGMLKAKSGSDETPMQAREATPNTVGANTLQALGENVPDRTENQFDAVSAQNSVSILKPPVRVVTYHDACHLAHGQGIREEPRDLLQMLADCGEFEVVKLTEAEMCCGSAGSYNVMQPEMAMQLLERKMKHIAATGAGVVVTGNPGCAMQIMLGAQKFGPKVEVLHPVQVLDRATK